MVLYNYKIILLEGIRDFLSWCIFSHWELIRLWGQLLFFPLLQEICGSSRVVLIAALSVLRQPSSLAQGHVIRPSLASVNVYLILNSTGMSA